MKYAAAAKMYQRFAKELVENKQLQKEIAGLSRELSDVEGCPLYICVHRREVGR